MTKQKKTIIALIAAVTLILVVVVLTIDIGEFVSDPEPLDRAEDLMEEFVSHKELKKIVKYSYGGTFHKSHFEVTDHNEGVIMWYCYDEESEKFYMAIEKGHIDDIDTLTDTPKESEQIVTDAFSGFDGKKSIQEFLAEDTQKPGKGTPQKKAVTKEKGNKYKEKIKKFDTSDDLKQKTRFTFFQNNGGLLQQLCTQANTKYIRYYFGCDSKYDTNRIRILLFSVDEQGKNILHLTSARRGDALVLQRSIPPQ